MTPDAVGGLQWQEPPPDGRVASKWGKVPDELRAHPGKWAKFGDCSPSTAGYLRGCWLPHGEFEVVSRATGDGKADIYARYIGGAS